jgi:hypothetical protein
VAEGPDSFVIAGTVKEIDATRGCLRVGESVVWVPAHALGGLDVGASVIVSGYRDGGTGRAIAELVRRPSPFWAGPPSPPQPAPRSANGPGLVAAEPPPVLALVRALLAEFHPSPEVLECSLVPSDDQYAILLQIPGEVGKGVLLPRRMLERALNDMAARVRVRTILRAAVEVLRSQRAITEARLTAYFTALDVRALPGPRCARCEGPLLADDTLVVHQASRRHLACPPAW